MADTAILLRKRFDLKEEISECEIDQLLSQSQIVKKLTKDYEENNFFQIFRIICLSEIPYVERLPYTKKILSFISQRLATPYGFSYTGALDYIVPCYNALLLEAYVRLGLNETLEVKNALEWIKKYQIFERGQITQWQYDGICKHGGCMHSTPCYIGIGKTVRALITYSDYINTQDYEVEEMIDRGVSYMLEHNMYQRLSNQKPISKHITDIIFPQAYMLSLTDLVYIATKRSLWNDGRTDNLKALLKLKMTQPDRWKIEYIYSHKGYKSFETRRNPSEWINYLYSTMIDNSD